ITVILSVMLIWLYTFKGGMKTIIYTDTLQTLFMLLAVGVTFYILATEMDSSVFSLFGTALSSEYSQIFFFEDWRASNFFPKHLLSGMFIAITMTGLDQDMMQKNMSCKNIGEAQKNILWFSIVLLFVNLLFLMLGALLYVYAGREGLDLPDKRDLLYPLIAKSNLGMAGAVIFLLGLIAAAYSSADSALTSLTTSFCKDFLVQGNEDEISNKKRYLVHAMFSVILMLVIIGFNYMNDDSVVWKLFKMAGYTYGPLLGLFSFGIFSSRIVKDKLVPIVCIVSPIICYFLNEFSEYFLFGYQFGFEILLVNGALTFMGLYLISKNKSSVDAG
ncbi:MAG: sodium:solute symporter, partial [Flavobacteriales bacterium]|nr:sodium:solute symporter [Flavobacteriales bacterium]